VSAKKKSIHAHSTPRARFVKERAMQIGLQIQQPTFAAAWVKLTILTGLRRGFLAKGLTFNRS